MTKQDQTITEMVVRSTITALQMSRCDAILSSGDCQDSRTCTLTTLYLPTESKTSEHPIATTELGSPRSHYPWNPLPQSPTQLLKRFRQAQADTECLHLPKGYPYPILSQKGQTKQAVQHAALTQG